VSGRRHDGGVVCPPPQCPRELSRCPPSLFAGTLQCKPASAGLCGTDEPAAGSLRVGCLGVSIRDPFIADVVQPLLRARFHGCDRVFFARVHLAASLLAQPGPIVDLVTCAAVETRLGSPAGAVRSAIPLAKVVGTPTMQTILPHFGVREGAQIPVGHRLMLRLRHTPHAKVAMGSMTKCQ